MAFGILEDHHLEKVPGTALLSDQGLVHGRQIDIDAASALKRGTGKYAHVILIPQPSDDPADPLNWPRWKKEACFWTLTFAASLDGALSPMVGPAYVLLSQQFGVSVDEITSSFGFVLLGLGTFMLVQNSLAEKFGHRIVYLGSVSLMFISCIWCAVSPNLASIRASRLFQGFGMSALQSMVASTLEQIYCVHERGSRTVIWSFAIMAGITLGPLLCSYVVQNLSWQWAFWFVSIPLGLNSLAVFFFVPETTYKRATPQLKNVETDSDKGSSLEKIPSEKEPDVESMARTMRPPSYISQLKIWHGAITDESFFKVALRPFPFLLSPVTWFMFLSYSMQTVWLSLMPLCSSTIFTLEYNFDAKQTGLTNLGGLVGIVLALFVTGFFIDSGVVLMSKWNRGVYEPEYRLLFMSSMLFGVFGYFGWAVGVEHSMPWIGAVACIAMANFSMVVSGSAAVTYLLDTHRHDALHVLALTNFMKNMVLYASTFFANGIIVDRGVKVSLMIFGACQLACWAASIPMYIYGKRVRSYVGIILSLLHSSLNVLRQLARHPRLYGTERND
ncbi:MFS general substrate transporter [Obba rivulosa]|uniref:MFS general substrate transporter n=1 Tax=Obba rivulosa TaxID=1052685 RepID=A0A8E2DKK3_9APHY|nr:MFS general substrate transporter [Obba rivulosa]